jgi:peptidyl-prolyl cis-trans isomerase SurA
VRSARRFLAAGFGSAVLLCAATAFPRVIDGVVALVNEEPVTFSEVRESVAEGMGIPVGDADTFLREERDPKAVLRWVEGLVETVLVRKELEKQGQQVSEGEIDRAVESVRKANGFDEKQFAEVLSREGLSLAAYRRRIRWQMERGAIVRARKFKEVTVTEDEVRDHFRENAERFLVGAQVRLTMLYFPLTAGEDAAEHAAQARFAAQQAAEAIRKGATFPEASGVARAAFPGAERIEGDFVATEDLMAEVQREVRRLRTGKTSQPFFTESGVYIVRVAERRGGTPGSFAEVKESLTEELTDRRSEKAFEDILADLKKSASLDVRL